GGPPARLAAAQGRFAAGKYADGLPIAAAVAEEAMALRYQPVQAEARLLQGVLERAGGQYAAARAHLSEALARAEGAQDAAIAARAAIELAWLVGALQWGHEEASAWLLLAEAAIERLGGAPELAGDLDITRGVFAQQRDRNDEALAADRRALASYERAFGAADPRVAGVLGNMGRVLYALGRDEEAAAYFERAAAGTERALGSGHPRAGDWFISLGMARASQGRLEESDATLQRALAIYRDSTGERHRSAAYALVALGNLRRLQGRTDEALALLQRALALQTELLGASHVGLGSSL